MESGTVLITNPHTPADAAAKRDDVPYLLTVTLSDERAQAVCQWLKDAWRHGDVVADDDRACAASTAVPRDRFAVGEHGHR